MYKRKNKDSDHCHTSRKIRRILRGMGLTITIPEFDLPEEEAYDNIYQLLPNTADGFAKPEMQIHYGTDPDPHWDDHSDPPSWEE